MACAPSTDRGAGTRERARGLAAGHGGPRIPLTDAAETLRQSSPQLLHPADLLARLRLDEVAHLGGAGPRQLRQTGPARGADNGGGRGRAARGRRRLVLLLRLLAGRGRRAALGRVAAAGLGPGPRPGARGRLRWCRGRPQSPPPGGPRAAPPPPPASFALLCKREPRGRGRRRVGGWRGRGERAAAGDARGTSSQPGARGRTKSVGSPRRRRSGARDPGATPLRLRLGGLRRPPGPAAPPPGRPRSARPPARRGRAPPARSTTAARGRTDGRTDRLGSAPTQPTRCAPCGTPGRIVGEGPSRGSPAGLGDPLGFRTDLVGLLGFNLQRK